MGGAGWGAIAQGVTEIGKVSAQMVAQRRAQKHATQAYKHRYRWSMKDMRKAGLNPILAFGGSPGIPQTMAPANIQQGSNIGAAIAEASRQGYEKKKAAAETERASSAADVARNTRSLVGQQNATEEWRTQYEKYKAEEQKNSIRARRMGSALRPSSGRLGSNNDRRNSSDN